MPHFFLMLSVNGSGPNSLSGGNASVKSGISAGCFSARNREAATGLSSAGAIPSG